MKKQNQLSKAEMKKVTGGVPAWSSICTDPVTTLTYCYANASTCHQFCVWGTCQVNYGSIGCN